MTRQQLLDLIAKTEKEIDLYDKAGLAFSQACAESELERYKKMLEAL